MRQSVVWFWRGLIGFCLLGCVQALGAITPAEKLLPPETLLVITTPDFNQAKILWKSSPHGQLWADAAMRPYREKLEKGWEEEVFQPLQRLAHLDWAAWQTVANGQLTLAVLAPASTGGSHSWVLMSHSGDETKLKKLVADLRQRWFESGKSVRGEELHGHTITAFKVSTNDLPQALWKMIPKALPTRELGEEAPPPSAKASEREIFVCQTGGWLMASSSLRGLEQVLVRTGDTSAPSLSDQAAYAAPHQSFFRNAPVYAWLNASLLNEMLRATEKPENPDAPNPFEIVKMSKLASATGLQGVRSVSLAAELGKEGLQVSLFVAVPESERQGIFRLLALDHKAVRPPLFVPGDVALFRRFRLNGQEAWNHLNKMMSELSPQWMSSINFILETATLSTRTKDPDFDIQRNLIANVGDDWIRYEKPAQATNQAGIETNPSLLLIGSPQPEQLAGALRSVLIFLGPQGEEPVQREFLGRKIYSVSFPGLPFPFGAGFSEAPRTLSYAANAGYVALSMDAGLLEEFLRANEGIGRPLAESAGLDEAAQRVLKPGSGLFGYQNRQELERVEWEILRRSGPKTNTATSTTPTALLGLPIGEKVWEKWQDNSLLPPFNQVEKYYHFSVSSLTATSEGITWRMHWPTPPALKQ